MRRNIQIGLLIICMLSLSIPVSVSAKSDHYVPYLDDQVIFGGTFTLEEGEVLDGSIIVIGGVLSLKEKSLVKGDVVAIGSSVNVAGEVTQSIIAIGGVLSLEETTLIRGDLIAPGSVMNRAQGAQIHGQVIANAGPINIAVPDAPQMPEEGVIPDSTAPQPMEGKASFSDSISKILGVIVQGLWTLFRAFAVSAVAVVLILFLPEQAKRTSRTILSQPVVSGLLGLLTLVIAGPVMVFLAITIVLIPATILIAVALSLGLFFGWIVFGQEIGRRIESSLGQQWSGPIQAGVGTLLITLFLSLINLLFWDILGWMFGILLASVGLGAVLLTRFGTHDYSSAGISKNTLIDNSQIQTAKLNETISATNTVSKAQTNETNKNKPQTTKTTSKKNTISKARSKKS